MRRISRTPKTRPSLPDNLDAVGDEFEGTTPGPIVALDNNYEIVVRAIETRRSSDTGPAQTTSQRVTVSVTNVDEPGVVTINWLQPEIGVVIMATLEDPDSPTPPPTWSWTVSNIANPDMMNDDNWRMGNGEGQDDGELQAE